MKRSLWLLIILLMGLNACRVVPAGHAKGCGHGPGKSESAPGQIKKHCR